jgi:DNA-binding NarL/FixJ family response regulator
MIRLAIVDDQTLMRAGIASMLATQPDIALVGEAADGAEAVDVVRRTDPDVVLMDVRMPGVDGIEATRRLRDHRAAIVMLTTFDLDEHVYAAMRAGAAGFLLKDTPPEDLIAGVRAAARGDSLLAPTVTRRLVEEFVRRPAPGADRPSELDLLTDRETEVLTLVARGLTNAEIATGLYLSHATVKTHVSRILTKLGLRDRAQAVVLAYEAGLVRPGDRTGHQPTAGAALRAGAGNDPAHDGHCAGHDA